MSGADSEPNISPPLTDAEISRFIALIDLKRLHSCNLTQDEISHITSLFHPTLASPATITYFMIFISAMSLGFAGNGLYLIYQVLKDFLTSAYNGINIVAQVCCKKYIASQKKQVQLSERRISLSRYSRTPDLKGLKDFAETYFAETYTVFRQESQDNSNRCR